MILFNRIGYKANEVFELEINDFYKLWNKLLMVRQEEDYSNMANFAFLATHISNMFSSKKNTLTARDLLGEFKPISLFNVKHISESTKKYIKKLDEMGIKYKLCDDGNIEILKS